MKKSTFSMIVDLVNGKTLSDEQMSTLRTDVNELAAAEDSKRDANRALYAAARNVVIAHLTSTPQTCAEIFDAVKAELPEGFTKSKMQYAFRAVWADDVQKHDEGRNPLKYSRK